MSNPLLEKFTAPFGAAPFDSIKAADYKPAFTQALKEAKAEITAITENKETPSFTNTIEALEASGKKLGAVSAIFFNIHSAETNDEIEQIAEEISPVLAAHSNDIMLNEKLFTRVKYVYDHEDRSHLDPEQQRLLELTFKGFKRNGALLSEEEKQQLREIDQQLSALTVNFSQNVLHDTNDFSLHITDEADLEGLPESIREMAAEEAKSRAREGWVFTLQYPSYVPFMKYAANRELRRKMALAAGRKAFHDDKYNNASNIRAIVGLRDQRARLMGYPHYAAFVLEERMAKTAATVFHFENDLLEKATPFAQREVTALKNMAAEDGISDFKGYDHAYYAEKLRAARYNLDEEALKPYFPLEQVLHAAFDAAGKLYGLKYNLRTDIPVYHPDVKVYEITENGQHKGLLYTDFYPRKGKRAGAWETSFREQHIEHGKNVRPHLSIVCNFSKPTGGKPSLLTFGEVTTLFHEFGHSLHGTLANTHYESMSGTNVYWDFVELPSQFMENYCYDPQFLKTFGRHFQTGEPLPDSEIDKIIASANFMEGYQTLRQLGFGLLDMAYHTGALKAEEGIEDFEQREIAATTLYPHTAGTAMSPSFSHIFAGGYAAGYYSYKWSEVLDADAFAYFKEKGIFNPDTAARFKTLLSRGGTEDPMDLYIAFRGRRPTVDALLERAGLTGHQIEHA